MDAKIEGIKHFCSVARVTYTIIWQSNQIIFKSVSVAKFFNLDFSKTGFFFHAVVFNAKDNVMH